MSDTRPNTRIPELDGIRGIAIGMVLIDHLFGVVTRPGSPLAYALVPLRLAWTGVDLFFVLSGFLIGGILLDARSATNYFRVFYTRRFFRIIPIYIALLLSVAFAFYLSRAGILAKRDGIFVDRLPWPLFPLFLQNIGMCVWQVWGTLPLSVTWSLAVEEQFYLTLPLLVRFLDRRALLRAILALIVAAPLLRTWFYFHAPTNFFTSYTLMPCRADALLLGVLGAVAVREPRWKNWLLARREGFFLPMAALLIGGAFLGLRAPSYRSPLMVTAGFTWMALCYLSCLLYGVLFPDSLLSRCLRWGWLRALGVIAYGVYLFHLFFGGLIFGRFPWLYSWSDLGLSFTVLVVTITFCRLSWIYFEKPLVRIGHRSHYQFESNSPAAEKVSSPLEASTR